MVPATKTTDHKAIAGVKAAITNNSDVWCYHNSMSNNIFTVIVSPLLPCTSTSVCWTTYRAAAAGRSLNPSASLDSLIRRIDKRVCIDESSL